MVLQFGANFRLPLAFSAFSPGDGDVSTSWGSRLLPSGRADELIVAADGSGHYETIQEALDILGAGSGTIRVKNGTYTITAALDLKASQTIIGSGYGTKIDTTSNITFFTGSGNRTIIERIRIRGNSVGAAQKGINLSGNECVVRNCWVENMGNRGVIMSGSEPIMESCRVVDCDDDNVVFGAGDHAILADSFINNSGGTGVLLTSAVGSNITGCQITNHGDGGVRLVSSGQCTITGNYIFSNGDNNTNGDGVEIAGNSHENCVTGNILHSNDGYGIDVQSGCQKNVIQGNSILNNEDGAILDNGTDTLIGTNSGAVSNWGYVDRGDPSSVDFAVGDLTTDGTVHDLDLSSIVPVNASSVLLHVIVKDGTVGNRIRFRKNGNSNMINIGVVRTQAANIDINQDVIIALDANRVIEYDATNTVFTTLEIIVKGWFI